MTFYLGGLIYGDTFGGTEGAGRGRERGEGGGKDYFPMAIWVSKIFGFPFGQDTVSETFLLHIRIPHGNISEHHDVKPKTSLTAVIQTLQSLQVS